MRGNGRGLTCERDSEHEREGLGGLDEGPGAREVSCADPFVRVDLEGVVVGTQGKSVDGREDEETLKTRKRNEAQDREPAQHARHLNMEASQREKGGVNVCGWVPG